MSVLTLTQETPPSTLLGQGLYSLREAAYLIGVDTRKLKRWAEGHTYVYQGETHRSEPIVHRKLLRVDGEDCLTFAFLIELKFVAMFRKEGVSLPTIRKIALEASRRFDAAFPFTVKRFDTDGRSIFATMESKATQDKVIEDMQKGQYVFETFARPFFRNIEYIGDEARLYRPLGADTRIILDPNRNFGKPIDEKSGVPAHVLSRMAKGEAGIEGTAEWYGVEIEAVQDAIKYEERLLQRAA